MAHQKPHNVKERYGKGERLVVKKNHFLFILSNVLLGKHSELSDGCKKSFISMRKSLVLKYST